MNRRMPLILILLSVALLWSADQPAWTMPEAQRQAIRDLADRAAVAVGLPDVRKGKWFRGTLIIKRDGSGDRKPLEPQEAYGVHARMPDGTWMANLVLPIPAGDGWRVEQVDLSPTTMAEALADAVEARRELFRSQVEEVTGSNVPPSLKPIIDACIQAAAPLSECDNSWSLHEIIYPRGLRWVTLIHARLPGSEEMLLLASVLSRYEMAATTFQPLQDQLRLHLPYIEADDYFEQEPWGRFTEPPDPLLFLCRQTRRDVAEMLVDDPMLLDDERHFEHLLTLDRALVLARQMFTGLDEGAWRSLQRLVERQTLKPQEPPSDLAARLQDWRCRDRAHIWESDYLHVREDCWPSIPDDERENLSAIADRLADVFQPQDADPLVALSADLRTSRAVDGTHPRTIGDQALRALSSIWKVDPRHLIGRDDQAPWTDAERSATAAALQAWWATNRQHPIEDLIIEALPRLCHHDLIRCLRTWPAAHRERLLAALAVRWRLRPADDAELHDLAAILAIAAEDAVMRSVIDTWPIDGSFHRRLLLAAWHVQQGRTGPLMTLADQYLDPGLPKRSQYRLGSLMPILEVVPGPDLLHRLLAACDAPFAPPMERVFLRQIGYGARHQETTPASRFLHAVRRVSQVWQQDHGHPRLLGTALGDAVFWHLLADQRLAPDPNEEHPGDRICDRAAAQAGEREWAEPDGRPIEDWDDALQFDVARPIAERDAAIARIRTGLGSLITAKLRAAGLGAMIRELGLPEPPPEPVF